MTGDDGTVGRFREALADPDLRAYYVSFAALAFVWEVFGRALPLYFRALGLSLALLGAARAAGSALALLAEPVSGLLADRADRAAVGAVAGLALGALLAAMAGTRTAAPLVALVALAPPVRQFAVNAVTPAVSEAVEEGAEGSGWALRDVGLYAGSALGVGVAGAVAAVGGVGLAFLPLVGVMAGSGALLWRRRDGETGARLWGAREGGARALPWGAGEGDSLRLRDLPAIAREAVASAAPLAAFREVSDWAVLGRLCAVEGLAVLGGGMSLFLLPAYAVGVGVPAAAVLFVFAAYNLAAIPVSAYGGGLADRRSRKWLYVGNYAAEAAMLAGFALAAVGGPALFWVGIVLYVGQTAFEPAVLSYFFAQFDDETAGRAWSVEGTVAKAAGVVAPAVGGLLYGVRPWLPFGVGAALLAAGAAVSVTLPPARD